MDDVLILGTVGREKVTCFGRVSPIVFGGTGFYAAEAMLKPYPTKPLLLSPLGNDLTPEEVVGQFSRKINASGMQRQSELPSFYWEASYERDFEQNVTLTLENRLIDEFHPDFSALHAKYPEIRACYLAAFNPMAQLECREQFADVLVVSETLEYWIRGDRDGVLDVARKSNGFIVTEREFRGLWGFDAVPQMPIRRLTDILESMALEFLIITFADRGSQVVQPEGTFFVPAERCATVDATGAGNAYAGGIVAHLVHAGMRDQAQLLDAAALGTALAALQVQDFGNRVLREATAEEIVALKRKVRSSITWFDYGH